MHNCVHLAARLVASSVLVATLAQAETLRLEDDFESGLDRWQTTDPDPQRSVWSIQPDPGPESGSQSNHVLRVAGPSVYQPPHRSPFSIALLKDHKVADFELTVQMQNTNASAGPHRDLCVFFGYQDPAHFYYVHLGAKADPHSCQIFIVNDAPRTKITQQGTPGIPWTDGWHTVQVKRKVGTGVIEVYFDDLEHPVMTACDTTFGPGRVGLGTFDDHGNFDNFVLVAETRE